MDYTYKDNFNKKVWKQLLSLSTYFLNISGNFKAMTVKRITIKCIYNRKEATKKHQLVSDFN